MDPVMHACSCILILDICNELSRMKNGFESILYQIECIKKFQLLLFIKFYMSFM